MNPSNNYQKFKKHLKAGGIIYAFIRGIKYFIFLIKCFKNRKRTLRNTISKGKIKIIYSGYGISLYWDEVEVTQGVGLNSAINTLGLWADSSFADWQILQKGNDYFKLRLVFKNLPLHQIWRIKIENEQEVSWQIEMQIEEAVHIDEARITCLASKDYKTWVNNCEQGDFPRLSSNWHSIPLDNIPSSLVGLRFPKAGVFLPSLALEPQEAQVGKVYAIVQNSPLDINAHLIGFNRIDSEEKKDYRPGYYNLFFAKIILFSDNYLLDKKIEGLRQVLLQTVVQDKVRQRKVKQRVNVLLVNLPWLRNGKWGVRAGSRWPHIKDYNEDDYFPFPFFLAYATSLLRKNNIEANLIDAIAEKIPESEFLEKISKMNVDYLVAETSIPSFYYDLAILKKISSMGIRIILCGPNSEIYQPRFLKEHPFISFVLYGEYEFSLLDLVKSFQSGKDFSKIRNLIYKDNDTVIKNPKREPFDINLLPWPYRDGLPMDKYLDAPGEMFTPSVQMLASRGCPFKCQFCLWPQVIYQGNHYRVRNVQDVVDEMEYLAREKGFKSVYFDDDTFNLGKKRMLNFCREIRLRGLDKIQWSIMARPDLMDEEILVEMKKAGLWAVKYGVESATQSLIDNIEKNMDLKKAERMIRFTKKLGIRVHLTFTFGLPGETKQTIEKTIKYARRLNPFSAQFSIMTPFPGTRYYKALEEKTLIISKDFSQYDGHSKGVIKFKNLSPEDLEIARERACRCWVDHLRKKRGIWGNLKRFFYYAQNKDFAYSINKTIIYFRYILLKRKNYLSLGDLKEGISSDPIDIIFIQCPPWDILMPPLGIAYLSSYLSKHGYRASVFDLNITLYNLAKQDIKYLWGQESYNCWVDDDLFIRSWAQLKEITTTSINKILKKADAQYIGLSVNFASIHFAIEIVKIIKHIKNEAKIILGGWGCINEHMRSLFPKELVDVFVVGEGEETLKEIMEVLEGNGQVSNVLGAVFNKDHQSVYKPRPAIMNLDTIPWPRFSEFHLDEYESRSLPLFTSRGCVGCCSFCNDWAISSPYRFRSAQSIFEEIKYHLTNNHINSFAFKDLLCNGNINELSLLSDLIINSGLKISWDSQAITRKEMSYEFLSKLQKAGCQALIYGIESFSNNVLRQMRKLFTAEIAERVLKDTHETGIKTLINIIVGFPGETEDDFQETLEGIKRNRRYISQIGAISVCLVNNDSDLDLNRRKYDIVWPLDPKIRAKEWFSIGGENTYEIRRRRAERLFELINQLGLLYETKTI